MTAKELDEKLEELWGSKVKPFNVPQTSRLINNIDFNQLTEENLITLLDLLGKASGSSMSGFSVDYDNYDILEFVRAKLSNPIYQSRRIEPIRRCYDILINQTVDSRGMFALATMYLISELEYLLKSDSEYLSEEGVVQKNLPRGLNRKISHKKVIIKGNRINQIGKILIIYCHQNKSRFAKYIESYDRSTIEFMNIRLKECYNIIDDVKIAAKYNHVNIFERISSSRNQIMHGEASFIGGEIFFFATLHAIYFLTNKNTYFDY